jgi:hypothetical protein
MDSSEQVEKNGELESLSKPEAELQDEEDVEPSAYGAEAEAETGTSGTGVGTVGAKLKELPGRKFDFKEDSETSAMFNSRLRIIELLKKLRLQSGVITSQEINMLSRMINNKLWYGVTYSKEDESYISYILNLL